MTLVDVAHEARLQRWAIRGAEASPAGWRAPGDDADALVVGHGRTVRVATLDAQAGRLELGTRRAVLAAGVEVVLALTAGDTRTFGERAQALRDARPDVVLVPLADRGGADRLVLLAESLRFGCAAQQPPPRVLLASNDDGAIARAGPLLSPFAVEVVPDVRAEEGRRRIVSRLRELRRATDEILLRDQAIEELARRLAEVSGGSALIVDVTGSSTSLVRAEPDVQAISVHARPLGVGRGADHVVARAGLDRVRRWIPWAVDPPTLLERVFGRARWPDAVAADRESLAVEIALAHEAVAHALADAAAAGIGPALRSAALVLVTGRAAALPGPARSVLVAVDALEQADPASISRDDGDALVATAAAALVAGDHGALDEAIRSRAAPAAAVVPVATSRRTTLRLASKDIARDQRVDSGAFFALALRGEVEVAGAGVTAGRVTCGPVGLVVDARPRPLALPARDAERVPTVARWYDALGALPSTEGTGAAR